MENTQKIPFYVLRDFSNKINATFAYIRQNYKSLGKAFIAIGLVPYVIVSGLYAWYQVSVLSTLGEGMDSINTMRSVLGPVVVLMVVGGLVVGVLQVTTIYGHMRMYNEVGPEGVTSGLVWEEVKSLFWRMLGGLVILSFALMLVGVVGVFLLFIPLLVMAVFWSIYPAMIVFEPEISLFEGLGRCFRLMSDKWFSTLGLLIVLGLINYAVVVGLSIPMMFFGEGGLGFFLSPGATSQSTMQVGFLIYNTIVTVVGALMSWVIYIGVAYQYANLVERKEGRGFMHEAENIGKDTLEDEGEEY